MADINALTMDELEIPGKVTDEQFGALCNLFDLIMCHGVNRGCSPTHS